MYDNIEVSLERGEKLFLIEILSKKRKDLILLKKEYKR